MFAKWMRQLTGVILLSGAVLGVLPAFIEINGSSTSVGASAGSGEHFVLTQSLALATIAIMIWWFTLLVDGILLVCNYPIRWVDSVIGVVTYLTAMVCLIGGVPNAEIRFEWVHIWGMWLFWVVPGTQFLYLCISTGYGTKSLPMKAI